MKTVVSIQISPRFVNENYPHLNFFAISTLQLTYHFIRKLRFKWITGSEHDQYHVIGLSTNQTTHHQATAVRTKPTTVRRTVQVKLQQEQRECFIEIADKQRTWPQKVAQNIGTLRYTIECKYDFQISN